MPPLHLLANRVGDAAAFWIVGVPAGYVGALGVATFALVAELRRERWRPPVETVWLVGIFSTGISPIFLFDHPGISHMQAIPYARMAAAICAAPWLVGAATSIRERVGTRAVGVGAAFVALAALVVVWIAVRDALIGGRLYAVDLVFTVAVVVAAAGVGRKLGRGLAVPLAAVAAALVASFNTPANFASPVLAHAAAGQPIQPIGGRDVTVGLDRALIWIRDHTNPNDVLAVNNPYIGGDGTGPFNFDYSALAERRTFLEGWAYNERTLKLGYHRVIDLGIQPFPERYRLNRALFGRGSASAFRAMVRRYGVTIFLVDKVASPAPRGLQRLARLGFRNAAADVFVVRNVRADGARR
jgi:hypothetical protein